MDLWRRCILLLIIINSEKFVSITVETGHTLLQSCGAFKLGNKCWGSEQSIGAEAAAVGIQGMFWSLFHTGTPGVTYSKLRLRFLQEPPLHTEVWYPLMAEVEPKACSAAMVPLSPNRVWGQLQVVKHCAKAYSSSREERGVPMMQLFYLPVARHLHKCYALVKKNPVMITSEN